MTAVRCPLALVSHLVVRSRGVVSGLSLTLLAWQWGAPLGRWQRGWVLASLVGSHGGICTCPPQIGHLKPIGRLFAALPMGSVDRELGDVGTWVGQGEREFVRGRHLPNEGRGGGDMASLRGGRWRWVFASFALVSLALLCRPSQCGIQAAAGVLLLLPPRRRCGIRAAAAVVPLLLLLLPRHRRRIQAAASCCCFLVVSKQSDRAAAMPPPLLCWINAAAIVDMNGGGGGQG
ncbi:hypothetical protein BDZ97DRAFT_1919776 [Flammula alnicola]|nr:hypothetical protein BDZ97DRAFT_1919776 [Flammula alnicola]